MIQFNNIKDLRRDNMKLLKMLSVLTSITMIYGIVKYRFNQRINHDFNFFNEYDHIHLNEVNQ